MKHLFVIYGAPKTGKTSFKNYVIENTYKYLPHELTDDYKECFVTLDESISVSKIIESFEAKAKIVVHFADRRLTTDEIRILKKRFKDNILITQGEFVAY